MLIAGMNEKQAYRKSLEERIRNTAEEYRGCTDPVKKEELEKRLRQLLKEQFDNTSADIKNQLDLQERRLFEIRERYEKRSAESSRQIEARLRKLMTQPPAAKETKDKETKNTGKRNTNRLFFPRTA